jgi:hypothetical protein
MTVFSGLFRTARKEGLGVTLHIAEVRYRSSAKFLLIFPPGVRMDGVEKGKFDGGGYEGIAQL